MTVPKDFQKSQGHRDEEMMEIHIGQKQKTCL